MLACWPQVYFVVEGISCDGQTALLASGSNKKPTKQNNTQHQQQTRVGKPNTFAEATTHRCQSLRKKQSPATSSRANYYMYDCTMCFHRKKKPRLATTSLQMVPATVVASNRSRRRSSRKTQRRTPSTPVADDDVFTFTEIEKPAAAAEPLGPLLKDTARRRS